MGGQHYTEEEVARILKLATRSGSADSISRAELLRAAQELGLSPEVIEEAEAALARDRAFRRERTIFDRKLRTDRRKVRRDVIGRVVVAVLLFSWLRWAAGTPIFSNDFAFALIVPAVIYVILPIVVHLAVRWIPAINERAFQEWRLSRDDAVPRDWNAYLDYYFAVYEAGATPREAEDKLQEAYGMTGGEAFAAVKAYCDARGMDYFAEIRTPEDPVAERLIVENTVPLPQDVRSLDQLKDQL